MKYEDYINEYGDKYLRGMTYRFYNSILVKYHDRVEFEDVLQICEAKVAFAINQYDEGIAGLNTFILSEPPPAIKIYPSTITPSPARI